MASVVLLLGYGRWGQVVARNLVDLGVHPVYVEDPGYHAALPAGLVRGRPPRPAHEVTHVLVCTPPATRGGLVPELARTYPRARLYLEKPAAPRASVAAAWAAWADRLFMPHLVADDQLLQQAFACLRGHPLRTVRMHRLGWGVRRDDVGVVHDLLLHDLGALLALLGAGRADVEVVSHACRDGEAAAVLRVRGAVDVWLQASWNVPNKQRGVVVTTEDGHVLRVDLMTEPSSAVHWDDAAVPVMVPEPPLRRLLRRFLTGPPERHDTWAFACGVLQLCDAIDPPSAPTYGLQAELDRHGERLAAAAAAVVRSGQYILGPAVARFEARLARACGVAHAVGCASGTEALVATLRACGLGAGDRVAVPALTFYATMEAVLQVGAVPVVVDVDDNYLMDPQALAAAAAPLLRAVIPVSLFGKRVALARLRQALPDEKVVWIEDACQSLGTRPDGLAPGWTAACTSFYPSKPLGAAGDAGAVLTDRAEVAARVQRRIQHGRAADGAPDDYDAVGNTGRLDAVQAAVLDAKLDYWSAELLPGRRAVGQRYYAALHAEPWVAHMPVPAPSDVWAQVTLEVKGDRDAFVAAAQAAGVPVRTYYRRGMHQLQVLQHVGADARAPCPRAETFVARCVSLPLQPYWSAAEQQAVIATLLTLVPKLTAY